MSLIFFLYNSWHDRKKKILETEKRAGTGKRICAFFDLLAQTRKIPYNKAVYIVCK